jgi:hypothetical protein
MDRSQYKVWWIPSPPNQPITMDVDSFTKAYRTLNEIYQLSMKRRHVGAGGLQVLDEKGEWVEWEDKNGNDIWDVKVSL